MNIKTYIINGEGFTQLSDDAKNNLSDGLLKQIAILRWGYDENKSDNRINNLIDDLSGLKSFYTFVTKGDRQINTPIIGTAYFCQDENNEKHWYYGDLVVHRRYKRLGIFRRLAIHRHWRTGRLMVCIHPQIAEDMIDMAMRELRMRKASKLFAYVAKDDKSSIALHKRLGFVPSENQENINDFDKNDKIVFSYNF